MDRIIRLYSQKAAEKRDLLKKKLDGSIDRYFRKDISKSIYSDLFFSPLEKNKLGLFITSSRLILISEELLFSDDSTILSVALHEAAHAICYFETGTAVHDEYFRKVCRELGTDDGFEKASIKLEERESILSKVKKLKALSQSPFEAEAQAALKKAQELSIEYHLEEDNYPDERIWEADLITSSRIARKYKILARIVSLVSGVFVISVHLNEFDGLRCYGKRGDVEVALYLWDTLERTIDKKLREERSNNPYLYQGQIGTTSFYLGVLSSIEERYRRYDNAESTTEIVKITNENRNLAKKLVFTDARIRNSNSYVKQNTTVYNKGKSFGSKLEIRQGIKKRGERLLLK
ncbi:MAG: DUF2786 domain-containing protein [Sphaerochaetaceae bacterium]|nr:DUF2786 domain-containing protein [Sphaerochaetaceae bacterium]